MKKLSFATDHFPVDSWTFSKDQPGTSVAREPQPNMVPLDFSGLGDLEEVCIGAWGSDEVSRLELENVAVVELEGGPFKARFDPPFALPPGQEEPTAESIGQVIQRDDPRIPIRLPKLSRSPSPLSHPTPSCTNLLRPLLHLHPSRRGRFSPQPHVAPFNTRLLPGLERRGRSG